MNDTLVVSIIWASSRKSWVRGKEGTLAQVATHVEGWASDLEANPFARKKRLKDPDIQVLRDVAAAIRQGDLPEANRLGRHIGITVEEE